MDSDSGVSETVSPPLPKPRAVSLMSQKRKKYGRIVKPGACSVIERSPPRAPQGWGSVGLPQRPAAVGRLA